MDVNIFLDAKRLICDCFGGGILCSGRLMFVNDVFADGNMIDESCCEELLEDFELKKALVQFRISR
jgi:hypothetical protein